MERLIEKLEQVGEKIDIGCKGFLGLQLIIITVVIIGQVVLRTFNMSIAWATEFSTLLFVWASLLGSAVASRYMLLIGVDTIRDRLKGKIKKIFMLFSHVVLAIGLIIFVFSSFEYTLVQMSHMTTTMPTISLAWFYCSLPICGVIMLYYVLVQFLEIVYYGDVIRHSTDDEDSEKEATK